VNVAMLVVAAQALSAPGSTVDTIEGAHAGIGEALSTGRGRLHSRPLLPP
jgi:hypothetical protein